MEKIVIVDAGIQSASDNKLFNRDFVYGISHTLLPVCYLAEEGRKEGLEFITPDVFLKNPKAYEGKRCFLISHLVSDVTEKLVSLGVEPLLLTCQESPFIATRFYMNLTRYTRMFRYSMLFPGMKKRTSSRTTFLPMFFPQFFSGFVHEHVPFEKKKGIVYIASNKETKDPIKTIIIKVLYGFSVQLIYALRRKIIRFLSDQGSFDLYGRGWEKETEEYIKKVYKGPVDDKEKVLCEYKYVLCLENAVFPGYITEKIFDCFFAGAVPLYAGAPDIDAYIPSNTYINVRSFATFDDLKSHLDSIDEETYNEYLRNIEAFLHSDAFLKWTHTQFTSTVLDLIRKAS